VIPPVRRDLPTYRELIYPTLRVVASLGGSAQGAEITDALIELLKATPEQLAVTYDGRARYAAACRNRAALGQWMLPGAGLEPADQQRGGDVVKIYNLKI
jgi:hypothetical protein